MIILHVFSYTTVSVGNNPIDVAITSDGKFAYVTDASSDSLSVIDIGTNMLNATITLTSGTSPHGLVITPSILPLESLIVSAKSKKNNFLTESDLMTVLTWSTPLDGAIATQYKIYCDGVMIATIPAGDFRMYVDHNRKKNRTYVYQVIAEDETGAAAIGSVSIKS